MTTASEARDQMFAVFKAAWDTTPVPTNVVYPDKASQVIPAGQAYARLSVRHADGHQSSLGGAMGAKRYTQTGTLWVQVFAPVGDGLVTAYALAQTVVNAYRTARGTVWFRNVRMQEVGNAGAFEQINVLATFNYDDVR
jgi:Bacteriophage related domain of unknown function